MKSYAQALGINSASKSQEETNKSNKNRESNNDSSKDNEKIKSLEQTITLMSNQIKMLKDVVTKLCETITDEAQQEHAKDHTKNVEEGEKLNQQTTRKRIDLTNETNTTTNDNAQDMDESQQRNQSLNQCSNNNNNRKKKRTKRK